MNIPSVLALYEHCWGSVIDLLAGSIIDDLELWILACVGLKLGVARRQVKYRETVLATIERVERSGLIEG